MLSAEFRAVIAGDCDASDALGQAGMDVNKRTDADRWNLLHRVLVSVVIPPKVEMVRHLIRIGVDVNAQDRCLWTPLHFAARTKNTSVVRMLLDAGAEVDAVNDQGITPLHLSLLAGKWNLELVEVLLAAGANPGCDRGGGTVRKFVTAVSNPLRDELLGLLERYAPQSP